MARSPRKDAVHAGSNEREISQRLRSRYRIFGCEVLAAAVILVRGSFKIAVSHPLGSPLKIYSPVPNFGDGDSGAFRKWGCVR
jgi:hypothetical protein